MNSHIIWEFTFAVLICQHNIARIAAQLIGSAAIIINSNGGHHHKINLTFEVQHSVFFAYDEENMGIVLMF